MPSHTAGDSSDNNKLRGEEPEVSRETHLESHHFLILMEGCRCPVTGNPISMETQLGLICLTLYYDNLAKKMVSKSYVTLIPPEAIVHRICICCLE